MRKEDKSVAKGMSILEKKDMEKAVKKERESRKRVGEERDRGETNKKIKKLKLTLAKKEVGLAGSELESVEETEVHNKRFLQVYKS